MKKTKFKAPFSDLVGWDQFEDYKRDLVTVSEHLGEIQYSIKHELSDLIDEIKGLGDQIERWENSQEVIDSGSGASTNWQEQGEEISDVSNRISNALAEMFDECTDLSREVNNAYDEITK